MPIIIQCSLWATLEDYLSFLTILKLYFIKKLPKVGLVGRGTWWQGFPSSQPLFSAHISTRREVWGIGLLVQVWAKVWVPGVWFCTSLPGGAETHAWASSAVGLWVVGGTCGHLGEVSRGS